MFLRERERESVPLTDVLSDIIFRSYICSTSYRFDKDKKQFSVSLVRQQISQLFTDNDGEATDVDKEHAVY